MINMLKMRQCYKNVLCLVLLFGCFPAGVCAAGIAWEEMSLEQQQILSATKKQWPNMPPAQQERLHKGAEQWLAMPPEERERARARMNRFNDLTPEERGVVKQRMQEFRELPSAQRQALRERWQNLTPDQREKMIRQRIERQEIERRRMERQGIERQSMGHQGAKVRPEKCLQPCDVHEDFEHCCNAASAASAIKSVFPFALVPMRCLPLDKPPRHDVPPLLS